MNLKAEIKVKDDQNHLKKLFESEKGVKNERATYLTKTSNNEFIISIKAKDATALRAMLNSVSKLISVYEKTKNVIENEN
ncbi:hypothetical protein GOV08_00280 [Candidatus Woesearchaeota archaeon]|nr:hypothetical protein [Candidatus Woesearchaeota archaeon]